VARLMALAIRCDMLLRSGIIRDCAELARLAHVSRARVSQVMGLLNLAPDLQEQLLNLQPGAALDERQLRAVVRHLEWHTQRELWGKLRGGPAGEK
jgi:hypothetical protein